MKAVLYLRVSTQEQTTDNQMPALRQMAEARGYEIAETFTENESAWKQGHQKELDRARVAAHRGEYQVLMVWALDRLTRGGIAAILNLVPEFERMGVKVVSYQESWLDGIDANSRELLMGFIGWIAQMESQRRSERIKAGMERVKSTGKTKSGNAVGRPAGKRDSHRRRRAKTYR